MSPKTRKILLVALVVVLVIGVFAVKKITEGQTPEPAPVEQGELPLEVTSIDFGELKSYGQPIMLDFGSESCGPCQAMRPALEAMYEEMKGKVVIQYTDVRANPEAAQNYPVQVIPTQIFFDKEGKPFVPSDKLKKSIGFTLYSSRDTGEHVFTVHQGGLTEEQMKEIFREMGVDTK